MLGKAINPASGVCDLAVTLHFEKQNVGCIPVAELGRHDDFGTDRPSGGALERRQDP